MPRGKCCRWTGAAAAVGNSGTVIEVEQVEKKKRLGGVD